MAIDPTYSLFTPTLIIVSVVFPLLATFVVGLRLYVKSVKRQQYYWEDWTIIISLVLCWGLSLILWIMAPYIGITRVKLPPEEAALETFKFFWINEIPFSIVLGMCKVSVLLFYQRVFAIPIFQRTAWTLITIIVMWSLAIMLVSIFKTNPVSGIWTNPEETYVIDDAAYSISVACMSLAFDVIILLMPLFVIRTLHMPTHRKIAVMFIFWLGAVACIASAARLQLLNQSVHSVTADANAYSLLTKAFVWAELEPNASVIAASLPMLRPLFSSDGVGLGPWFSSWGSKVFSMFSRKSGSKQGSEGDLFAHPGGTSTGYAKASSVTESTRGLNGDIAVRHDIELGYYEHDNASGKV